MPRPAANWRGSKQMLENLQILRALAALAVVVYHVLYTAGDYGRPVHALIILHGWGRCGVDVFFVISGFVMVYAQSHRPKTAAEFLRQRLLRIVPLYWLLTLALGFLTFAIPGISKSGPPSPGKFFASLFFLSTVLYRDLPVIFVGWSLEYEIFFYVLFAIAIALRRPYAFIGGSLLLLACFSLLKWVALEFLFGMLVCAWFQRSSPYRHARACAGAGLLLLIVPFSGPDVVVFGIPACLLVLGAASMRQIRSPFWNFLGAASYSLYLVQVFAIPTFYKAAAQYLNTVPGDVLAILAVAWTVALGCALHVSVERPFARILKRDRLAKSSISELWRSTSA
jgi:peptidoglycan/LPS O-acetylase OafA/YrhL